MNAMRDFRDFILRGNVVDLAVGIIIGVAFGAVVTALVKDIITPLIPATNTGLSSLAVKVGYSGGTMAIGDFINSIISFLVIAFVVFFFVVRPVNALMRLRKTETPVDPTTRECPFCLSSVPIKATRCAYCTSQLVAEPAA